MNKIINNKHYMIRCVWVAYHDMDKNEYGDKKTPHYHVVVEFEKRMELKTCFNWIGELFHCNDNQISIEKTNDIGAQVRYLIHLDNEDKYPYPSKIIYSNNFEQTEFYLSYVRIKNEKHFLEVLDNNPSKRALLRILGKKQYKEWRFAIQDLLKEY